MQQDNGNCVSYVEQLYAVMGSARSSPLFQSCIGQMIGPGDCSGSSWARIMRALCISTQIVAAVADAGCGHNQKGHFRKGN